ncbi:putative transcription factor bZIP family [Helianthus annuus]|uniref:Transcription factor bZIP family n=2 Tax=Helianthus annuus TaxID=4232 RepID=A0A251TBZ4_HELAN|nr:putative transcription factor bZIP family [Helianthus annuus]KAJ0540298.1 putative transcription factor bZIP family [Helianthus annuus]KAJ0548802.1 putative transcription factor bZIP family [Helianthus annuus]KAJ0555041.1 putative transcription factor bZIP family [Helianthus annuus]KAJ0720608.1 putative transcription factor bZIP family [Helianthus annuus]
MENGHNMSTVDNLQMIPFDDNDPEVIARRIKNRERQRRYRARKRQEADSKRASMINHQVNNTPVNILTDVYSQQVEQTQVNETPANIVTPVCKQVDQTQSSDTPVNIVTRVYSQRNWKKDARTAHLLKQQKLQQQNVASSTCATASTDLGLSGIQSNVIVDTREHSSTPSGRNWKAEARNKRY